MTRSRGHHQVDFLKRALDSGGRIVEASFSIERDIVTSNPMYLLTLEQNGIVQFQELAWTPELEEFLLFEQPTRMAALEEEMERLANVLSNNLATVESRFGKDYAQAVFVELVGERPEYQLDALLAKAPVHAPPHDSASYATCRGFLEHAVDGLHNGAILNLGYQGDEVLRLLRGAIGIVLDDRFHISVREKLFPRT